MNTSSLITSLLMAAVAVVSIKAAPATMATTATTTKPGCPRKCGNVTVPYPFGVGMYGGCSIAGPTYDLFCNTSFEPPKPFLFSNNVLLEVLDISETRIRIRNGVAFTCFNSSGHETSGVYDDGVGFDLGPDSPFTFSSTSNKLVVVGCNDKASVLTGAILDTASASCTTKCSSKEDVVSGSCNGKGCCEATLPKKRSTEISVAISFSSNNTEVVSFNPCGYAFLGEKDKFVFRGAPDLDDPSFIARTTASVPIVLNWVIGNQTCDQAQKNASSYACQQNTTCSDDTETGAGGYQCGCLPGYQGNPYLAPGCRDINECEDPSLHECSDMCHNTEGGYFCTCPSGYSGDAKTNGTGCVKKSSQVFFLRVGLGVSFGFLLVATALGWVFLIDRKRRLINTKKKYFKQNGGLLMKELLSSSTLGGMEGSKIFTVEELKLATRNFSEDLILGTGGYGTVYRGFLPNDQVVAIKKSKVADQTQIEQFINEMVILTQINHRNVVKLHGCCLETEVPLLVYEFVSNGTLFDLIHNPKKKGANPNPRVSWSSILRIAVEAADALAYLHSAANPPVIHRDVKSANILLDESYTTKISDFGASRLIPLDQSELSTLVQGTLGYLDPEYFFSSLLTEKSDVYSFGVVLAEMLTGMKPIDQDRPVEERNLATYFVASVEEGRLMEMIDCEVEREASEEQLSVMALLVKRCLNMRGKDRPTMREVATELEGIRKMMKSNSRDVEYFQETEANASEEDLYPLPSVSLLLR